MEQAAPETLVIDDRDAGLFRVHRSVFTDPRILELERRHLFERATPPRSRGRAISRRAASRDGR